MTNPTDPFAEAAAQAAAEAEADAQSDTGAEPAAPRARRQRAQPEKAAASGAATRDAKYWSERIAVQFNESEDMPPNGVPVGVNGVAFLIKPGIPVKIPRSVLHVIDNAVAEKPIFDNGKVRGYRKVSRFTYTVLSSMPEHAAQ